MGGGGRSHTRQRAMGENKGGKGGREQVCVRRHIQLPGGVGGEKRVLLRKVYGGGSRGCCHSVKKGKYASKRGAGG